MRTILLPIFLSLILLLSSFSFADDLLKNWTNPPDQGFSIELFTPTPNSVKDNTDVTFEGKIILKMHQLKSILNSQNSQLQKVSVNSGSKDNSSPNINSTNNSANSQNQSNQNSDQSLISDSSNSKDKKDSTENLLTLMQKEGFIIKVFYPDYNTEVSNLVRFETHNIDTLQFKYIGKVNQNTLNQFTIQILPPSIDATKVSRLFSFSAKLQSRVTAIENLIQTGEIKNKDHIQQLSQFKNNLISIQSKISKYSFKNGLIVAGSTQNIQLDNLRAGVSNSFTTMFKTVSEISIDPGNTIQGMSPEIKIKFTDLHTNGEVSADDLASQDDLRVAQLTQNDKIVFQSKPFSFDASSVKEFLFTTERLSSSPSHHFKLELFAWNTEENRLGKRKTYSDIFISTNQDLIAPKWLDDSHPINMETYYQNPEPILVKAFDSFGRIDPSSINIKLSGTLIDGGIYNKDLSNSVVSTSFRDGEEIHFSGLMSGLIEGDYIFSAAVKDLALNSTPEYQAPFHIDRTPPKVVVGLTDHLLTRDTQILVPVEITDRSPIWINIYLNGRPYLIDGFTKKFSFILSLKEGLNTLEVECTDVAGNKSSLIKYTDLVLDTTPPVLSNILPKDDAVFQTLTIPISGKSNEKLKSLKVNNKALTLSSDGLSFSGSIEATFEGLFEIDIDAEDLAGNTTNENTTVIISMQPLNLNLIQVVPNADQTKLIVNGAAGATKPYFKVSVQSSFFNAESTVADADGSFSITMDPFSQATVNVINPINGKKYSGLITFGEVSNTLLSGKVKTINDEPLVNASISIVGTTLSVKTDATGAFVFRRDMISSGKTITGDQMLVIDGSTVNLPLAQQGKFKYGLMKVAITLGLTQTNVLLRPIFLAPLIVDGSETIISITSGGKVTSQYAAGVELNIPANSATFPDNSKQSAISLQTIPTEFATIPPVEFSKPNEVVALEPSGTTFSIPIELTLPNRDDLPVGTDMVIMLMNSKTGRWEIGGAAKVTDDGRSIRTKPNLGIKHFSLAYATILGPIARERRQNDKVGAGQIFDGAVTNTVSLPAFKTLGKNIVPSLIYKSQWAKPSIIISNMLDLPNRDLELPPDTSGITSASIPFEVRYCTASGLAPLLFTSCSTKVEEYYRLLEYKDHFTENKISTEKITAQFSFLDFTSGTIEFQGTPDRSTISYGAELKNKDGEYLPSGIYPYTSKYRVQVKNKWVGTRTIKTTNLTGTAQIDGSVDISGEQLDTVFPPDLTGEIYLQNNRNSEAGLGWKMAGAQKIINPTEDKILIEEADGSTSTYTVDNTIETVLNGNNAPAVNLSGGVGLAQWPTLLAKDKNYENILQLSMTSSPPQVINSFKLHPGYSGTLAAYLFYNIEEPYVVSRKECTKRVSWPGGNVCTEFTTYNDTFYQTKSVCLKRNYDYSTKPFPYELLLSPDGFVYGTDNRMNAIFSGTPWSAATNVAGLTRAAPNYKVPLTDLTLTIAMNKLCTDKSLDCVDNGLTKEIIDGKDKCGTTPKSTGLYPVRGIEYAYMKSYYGLNNPKGLTPGRAPNILVFADYGNHRIGALDLTTKNVYSIAGDGNNYDTVNTTLATSAGIQHPNDVVYDQLGNLYISSEAGIIRKVDTLGNISVIAGALSGTIFKNSISMDKVSLANPHGLAFDNNNNLLYIADKNHHRIVKLDFNTGLATTIAGNTAAGFSGDSGNALNAMLNSPEEIGLDDQGNLLINDKGNNRVRRVNFKSAVGGKLSFTSSTNDGSKITRNEDGTWIRTYLDGSKVTFSKAGRQTYYQSPDGLLTSYSYDFGGRLIALTLPTQQKVNYKYSGAFLSSIIDTSGRTTFVDHDFNGRLTKVTFPDNSTRIYEYSDDGLLIKEKDQLNQITQYEYDEYNHLKNIIKDGSLASIKDAGSSTVIADGTSIDSGTVSTLLKDPMGNQTEFIETTDGFIGSIKNAEGQITKMQYDTLGRVNKVIFPDNNVKTIVYDGNSQRIIKEENSQTGKVIFRSFNTKGLILSEEIRSKTDNSYLRGTYKTYDPYGRVMLESSTSGISTAVTYNTSGLVTRVESKTQSTVIQWEDRFYDTVGNITKIRSSQGPEVVFSYDTAGNMLTKTMGTKTTRFRYDLWNRLIEVQSPAGEITRYTYSLRGELLGILDPKEKLTQFAYDNLGRLIAKKDPLNREWAFTYDANSNLVQETDPKGQVKNYIYSSTNKLIQKSLPDENIIFAYNNIGELTNVENSETAIAFSYDVESRIIGESYTGKNNNPSWNLSRNYNLDGNVTSMSADYYGTESRYYNTIGQLSRIINFKNENTDFTYDLIGRLNSITRGALVTGFNFGTDQRLSAITNTASGTVKSSYQYLYNSEGLISSITNQNTTNYTYNENSFLTQSSVNSSRLPASVGQATTETFAYDNIGNRLNDANGSFQYDPTGQELKEDYKYTYIFDANGNLAQRHNKLTGEWLGFTFNSENQLKEINFYSDTLVSAAFKTVNYSYDPLGRRIGKKVFDSRFPSDITKTYTRLYIYNNNEIISELDANKNIIARYTHSGLRTDDVLSVDISDEGVTNKLAYTQGTYHYLKDHLGTIKEITDSNGNIVQRYHYSAYGIRQAITDGVDNELTGSVGETNGVRINTAYAFTGREYDEESGFYYYRARYYDAHSGRFLQQDRDPGKLKNPITAVNKFIYASNSPAFFTDPLGLSVVSDLTGVDIDFLGFGHSLIAEAGAAFDKLIKDPGFQFVLILIASIPTGTTPIVLTSLLVSTAVSGIAGWYNGNRSIDAFLGGVNNFLTDPKSLRNSAATGMIAGGLSFAAVNWFDVDPQNIRAIGFLTSWIGNSKKLHETRMSMDERSLWTVILYFTFGTIAVSEE